MRPIATIDCETDPFKRGRIPAPFVWGFYDAGYMDHDKPFYLFIDTAELVAFLEDKEFIIYAHNGGKFDYHYLLDYISDFDPVKIINGRLSMFHIGICEFRDSFNILPVPLSAYKKTIIDYGIMEKEERYKPENWAKIINYLEDDCRDLHEVVTQFIDRFGLHLTQASAAMKQWEKISGAKAPKSTEGYYNHFRQFYFGGRTQAFKPGIHKGTFKLVDINSAYPRAMIDRHPYGLSYESYTGEAAFYVLDELEKEEIGSSFFVIEGVSKGIFPFRDKDGSLYFPDDNESRIYHITGWEFIAALDTGVLTEYRILEAYVFEDLVSFTDYIYQFYNEKKLAKRSGDIAGELFAKLFQNGLYGKFGANPEEYNQFIVLDSSMLELIDPNDKDGFELDGTVYKLGGFLGSKLLAEAPLDENAKRYYNVATSASITGWVRAYLWRAMCRSKNLLYCDTDSILAENIDVLLGEELGEWDLQGEFTVAVIAGRKLYALKYKRGTEPKNKKTGKKVAWKTASKGVNFGYRDIIKVAKGQEVIYDPEVPTYSVRQQIKFVPRHIKMLEKDKARLTSKK